MIKILLILNLCHWAADYTHLSTKWMLDAKKNGTPLIPIAVHALVHGGLMFSALSGLGVANAIILSIFQIITHFGIDVLKGKMNVWFPSLTSPANVYHWWVFGADQYLHQAVIILMAYWSVT